MVLAAGGVDIGVVHPGILDEVPIVPGIFDVAVDLFFVLAVAAPDHSEGRSKRELVSVPPDDVLNVAREFASSCSGRQGRAAGRIRQPRGAFAGAVERVDVVHADPLAFFGSVFAPLEGGPRH